MRSIGCCLDLALSCLLLIGILGSLINGDDTTENSSSIQVAQMDRVRVSGWTEINKRWPLEQEEYFVANTKGHHHIEIVIPEKQILNDLKMRFDYRYDFAQVHPTLEVVACNLKIQIQTGEESEARGHWQVQEIQVKKEDCVKRKNLTFNILLDDADDIFAWRKLEISDVSSQGTTKADIEASSEASTEASTEAPTEVPTEASTRPATLPIDQVDVTPNATTRDPFDYYRGERISEGADRRRLKRASGWSGNAICKPSSCNRDLFHMSDFKTLIHGLPPVTAEQLDEGKSFYLNDGEKAFEFVIESTDDLTEVNSCIDVQLYMEADTSLEFMVQDEFGRGRSLELVERKATDSACNKWESFKRCIHDYLPKLRLPANGTHSIHLSFLPQSNLLAGKQIALLLDQNRAGFTKKMYPIYDYLPDVLTLVDESHVDKYWILDRDGFEKPQLTFESSSAQANERRLRVGHIDPNQEHFDLVSRWIKVDDPEQLENPLLFIYRVQREDWIESIDFGFQSGSADTPDWISQKVYVSSSSDSTTQVDNEKTDELKRQSTSQVASADELNMGNSGNLIPLPPIKLKGLTRGEFRIRIRHHLRKRPASTTQGFGQKPAVTTLPSTLPFRTHHQLVIRGLSFGDLCAQGVFCKNGGKCTSLGAAKAECTCLQGYLGDHCEKVNYCEVKFGNMTGAELCHWIGAECIPELPSFRCHWPNDQYYECNKLYQVDANGTIIAESLKNGSQIATWKDRAERQSRLIIVLSVFMLAMLLFSVVIVANLVSRLLKSRRALKGTQLEVVELTRRSIPSTSANATFDRLNNSRPKSTAPAPISYSNQSFDTS